VTLEQTLDGRLDALLPRFGRKAPELVEAGLREPLRLAEAAREGSAHERVHLPNPERLVAELLQDLADEQRGVSSEQAGGRTCTSSARGPSRRRRRVNRCVLPAPAAPSTSSVCAGCPRPSPAATRRSRTTSKMASETPAWGDARSTSSFAQGSACGEANAGEVTSALEQAGPRRGESRPGPAGRATPRDRSGARPRTPAELEVTGARRGEQRVRGSRRARPSAGAHGPRRRRRRAPSWTACAGARAPTTLDSGIAGGVPRSTGAPPSPPTNRSSSSACTSAASRVRGPPAASAFLHCRPAPAPRGPAPTDAPARAAPPRRASTPRPCRERRGRRHPPPPAAAPPP
jgi:hypothetical protein